MSMYGFIDTVQGATGATGSFLPTEAVKINGEYIEDLIEGYRTLYVSGRESLEKQLKQVTVGSADGDRLVGSRYPSRTLTVGFQLIAKDAGEFRDKFTNLNNLLSLEEADFVFADEPTMYFTGTPMMNASVAPGRNAVTGEYQIYCAYPFKRSVDLTTLSSNDQSGVVVDSNSATFTFNYSGSRPSRPILRASFAAAKSGGDYTEDGDCGDVAFLDDEENIIQLGNPEVIEQDPEKANATIINSEFSALTGWTSSNMSVSNITDTYWNNGGGQTMSFAKPSGTAYLTRSVSDVVNFECNIVQRLCVNATNQTGKFEYLTMHDDKVLAGYKIEKTGSGTNATVSYIVDDKVVGTDSIDVSYYNTNFGYCKRTEIMKTVTYKQKQVKYVKNKKTGKKKKKTVYVTKTKKVLDKYVYTQSNLKSGFVRDDNQVVFTIGNLPKRTYKSSGLTGQDIDGVVINYKGNFHTNALRSVKMVGKSAVFAEIPNVFTAGDVVEADCNDANVYVYRAGAASGHIEPQYGALGNDWEDFEIKPGQNVIKAVWSDWVDPDYKPLIQIIFNEVYL